MPTEDDAARLADEQANAAFESGFPKEPPAKSADKPADKPVEPPKPAAPAPAATPQAREPAPEYVRITKKDWDEVRAAAARTASYDGQFSKAFGTIGNLQKMLGTLQAGTPRGTKVVIPQEAFADMERDFPELAGQMRKGLEAALVGKTGTGASDADPVQFETMLATYTAKREAEALEDAFPDWREIVGAVDVANNQQPDLNHPFRKWLGTKPEAYQARINASMSAAVIERAIRTFQTETRAAARQPAATPRPNPRADRIRDAVQPRGDRGAQPAGPDDEDEFQAGFNSR